MVMSLSYRKDTGIFRLFPNFFHSFVLSCMDKQPFYGQIGKKRPIFVHYDATKPQNCDKLRNVLSDLSQRKKHLT